MPNSAAMSLGHPFLLHEGRDYVDQWRAGPYHEQNPQPCMWNASGRAADALVRLIAASAARKVFIPHCDKLDVGAYISVQQTQKPKRHRKRSCFFFPQKQRHSCPYVVSGIAVFT